MISYLYAQHINRGIGINKGQICLRGLQNLGKLKIARQRCVDLCHWFNCEQQAVLHNKRSICLEAGNQV
jgi:hypothetical protein